MQKAFLDIFNSILNSIRELLMVLDSNFKVVAANPSFYKIFCVTPQETGTDKGLVAHAIHSFSKRKNRAIVKINCAAQPSNLIESELFGYEKGAFTGSSSRHRERFFFV